MMKKLLLALLIVLGLTLPGSDASAAACNILAGDLFPCDPVTGQCFSNQASVFLGGAQLVPTTQQHCHQCFYTNGAAWTPGSYLQGMCPESGGCNPVAPGQACNWNCGSVIPANQCDIPGVVIVGALTEAAKLALLNGQIQNQQMVARWMGHLKVLQQGSASYKGMLGLIVNVLAGAGSALKAVADPPNPGYQFLPSPGTTNLAVPIAAGTGLTQAQADAINLWQTKMMKHLNRMMQYSRTYDNLSGAVAANDGPWVRRLAAHGEATMNLAAKFGKKAFNARNNLTAPFPVTSYPAYCVTQADLTFLAGELLGGGISADLVNEALDGLPAGTCAPAGNFPTDFVSFAAQGIIDMGSLMHGENEIADNVCAATGFCFSTTSIGLGILPPVAGNLKVNVTVTADGQYDVLAGDTVTAVFSGGLAPKTVTLAADGTALLKVVGVPAGTYTVTVTYPEMRGATLAPSVATITVTVP